MTNARLYKLIDLVEDIKKLDAIIALHGQSENDLIMLDQYKASKVKLISDLIKDLNMMPLNATYNSLVVMKKILDKFIVEGEMSSSNEETEDLRNLVNAI